MLQSISAGRNVARLLLGCAGIWFAGSVATAQLTEIEFVGVVAEIRGACPSLMFSVNDTMVSTDGETDFDGVSCSDIQNGIQVEVEGIRQASGQVLAIEVEPASEDDADDDDDDDDEDAR